MNLNKTNHNNNYKMKLLALLAMTVTGCASNYTLSTNVDKENFQRYFSHSQVKVVENTSKFTSRYKLIGLVEGEDCQVKAHHAAPNKIAARTQARRKAFEQNANAIVFTGCALINDKQTSKQCISTIVCYGQAYQVEQVNNDK
jgi:RcsF protein